MPVFVSKILCKDCSKSIAEEKGKWLILSENTNQLKWVFMCLNCIRDWRKRALEREGFNCSEINHKLNKEYPIG